MPDIFDEYWHRCMPVFILALTVAASCLIGLTISFGHETKSNWSLTTINLMVLGATVAFASLRNDHELLFGCFTVFTALTAIAVYAVFFSYSSVR